jgi:hypothetical protein
MERLALYPTFNFGRLRQLIDALNVAATSPVSA